MVTAIFTHDGYDKLFFLIKATLLLFMAVIDIENTKRKIEEFGVEVELNKCICKLCEWLGVNYGVTTGILVPTGAAICAGWYYPPVLTFCLGAKLTMFLFQLRSYAD